MKKGGSPVVVPPADTLLSRGTAGAGSPGWMGTGGWPQSSPPGLHGTVRMMREGKSKERNKISEDGINRVLH